MFPESFPEIDLFPKIAKAGRAAKHFVTRLVSFCPLDAPDYMSEHNHRENPLDVAVTPVTQLDFDAIHERHVGHMVLHGDITAVQGQFLLGLDPYEAPGSYYFKDK